MAERSVRFKTNRELPKASEGTESPYDAEARYRHKRDTQWTGYMIHVSETCEPIEPSLLTHVHTTSAAVHEAKCTDGGSWAKTKSFARTTEKMLFVFETLQQRP